MSDDERLTPAEHELEAALAAVEPATPAMTRDALMFEAGRMSVRPTSRLWPLATAVCALLAVGMGVYGLVREDQPPRSEVPDQPWTSVVCYRVPALLPREIQSSRRAADYLQLRKRVLAEGIDALPEPKLRAGPPVTVPRESPSWWRPWHE